MIISQKPLSIAEVKEFIKKDEEKNSKINSFIKKFSKLNIEDAKEIQRKIEELNSINIREEQIVKIIDICPENAEELNKILSGSHVDEEESKKILDLIKEYK